MQKLVFHNVGCTGNVQIILTFHLLFSSRCSSLELCIVFQRSVQKFYLLSNFAKDRMAVTLFFGIRLSGKPYERIAHKLDEDAYSTYKVENLKRLLVDDLFGNNSSTAEPSALGKGHQYGSFSEKTKHASHILLRVDSWIFRTCETKENVGMLPIQKRVLC